MKTRWSTFVVRKFVNELSDFSANSKDHFKCILFSCGLHGGFKNGICCQTLKNIEESDKVILGDLANKCMNMSIKYDSGMNQQK